MRKERQRDIRVNLCYLNCVSTLLSHTDQLLFETFKTWLLTVGVHGDSLGLINECRLIQEINRAPCIGSGKSIKKLYLKLYLLIHRKEIRSFKQFKQLFSLFYGTELSFASLCFFFGKQFI